MGLHDKLSPRKMRLIQKYLLISAQLPRGQHTPSRCPGGKANRKVHGTEAVLEMSPEVEGGQRADWVSKICSPSL